MARPFPNDKRDAVYMYLRKLWIGNKGESVSVTLRQIADEIGISTEQANRLVSALESGQRIKIEPGHGSVPNKYVVLDPEMKATLDKVNNDNKVFSGLAEQIGSNMNKMVDMIKAAENTLNEAKTLKEAYEKLLLNLEFMGTTADGQQMFKVKSGIDFGAERDRLLKMDEEFFKKMNQIDNQTSD